MPQERSEAVVVRGVDFSETSRIVTLLLPARGRMACLAKGARRKGSSFGGTLDTLNRIEAIYYWKDGREVQQLTEATVLNSYGGIKADLGRSAYCSFPLELAGRVAHENEPSQGLFSTLVRGLDGMDKWQGAPRAHACWQVVQLLITAGFEPSLELCADCGKPVSGPAWFAFRGGLTCGACAGDRRVSADELDDLRALAANRRSCPDIRSHGPLFNLLHAYASHQMEATFRSFRVIEDMKLQ